MERCAGICYSRGTMIIAQISDTHIDLDGPNGAVRIRDLERCVEDINRLDPLPDVVIHTGDMTHNANPAEYREAARILAALRAPLHVAPGNRDDRTAIRHTFPEDNYLRPELPFVQYSVDAYPVRLIAVDTLSGHNNKGDFCAARADSLQAALEADGGKPAVVFMHHPPFEVRDSKYPLQFESWDPVALMAQALDGQRNVARLLCGHTHRDTGGEIAGLPVTSMPSVAVDLRLGRYPDADQAAPMYKLHKFNGRDGFVSELRAAPEGRVSADEAAN